MAMQVLNASNAVSAAPSAQVTRGRNYRIALDGQTTASIHTRGIPGSNPGDIGGALEQHFECSILAYRAGCSLSTRVLKQEYRQPDLVYMLGVLITLVE